MLLSAATSAGLAGVAGAPVALRLELTASGASSQEVEVSIGEPHGFVLAGARSTTVHVAAGQRVAVSWEAVPYHAGLMRLPEVRLAAPAYGQAVQATDSNCFVSSEKQVL